MAKRVLAVLLLGTVGCGCATQEGLERDGQRYGVTKGVFRGRWWSYYERGTSYLAGEFYAEAEADFGQALVGRGRDTWQARTYGLHFVEYFPNRELGVACYHLGRLDEAEDHLKRSLTQIDTARAHHYLDLVAKAKIAKGDLEDAAAPSVETSLGGGLLVADRAVAMAVRATDDVGVSAVAVNGRTLPQRGSAEDITFEDEILFVEGTHEIRVEASDLADKEAAQTVTVEVDLTGPTIGIFSPEDAAVTDAGSVRVEGTCIDKNGVTSVALDGRELARSEGETKVDFATELALKDGENVFVVVAKDAAGNETRSAVAVYKGDSGSAGARLWRLGQRAPQRLEVAAATGRGALEAVLTGRLASGAVEDAPAIRLKSPKPDRPYRHNKTLCVSGEVVTTTRVASLSINGEPFEALTGAPKESFNRRIPIDQDQDEAAEMMMPITVAAKDAEGRETTEAFEVSVRPIRLDSAESKMPVAVLAFAGSGIEPAVADLLRVTTEAQLHGAARFRMLDRTRLQDVLTEQQLAAVLADPDQAIRLGKLTNAHVFVTADVFTHGEKGLEIKARAISPETSDIVAILDAYIEDKGDTDQVEAGCLAIADQLTKTFPRLSGELLAVRPKPDGNVMLVNWTKEDGIREGVYMLVVQEDEPWVDETTGEVLAEGEVLSVARGRIQRISSGGAQAKEVKQEGEGATLEPGMAAITM